MSKPEKLTIITSLDYRGQHIDFFDDPDGNQVFTIWKGKQISFGAFNIEYAKDMQKIIDLELDTICIFHNYPSARLVYFDNRGERDVKLVNNKRILQVYLHDDPDFNIETLPKKALRFLNKLYSLKAN